MERDATPFRYETNDTLKYFRTYKNQNVNFGMQSFSFKENNSTVIVGKEKGTLFFSEVHLQENIHTVKILDDSSDIYEIVFISD